MKALLSRDEVSAKRGPDRRFHFWWGLLAVAMLVVLMGFNALSHSAEPHSTTLVGDATHASAVSSAGLVVHEANQTQGSLAEDSPSCVGCTGFHTGMAAACVIALLLIIALLPPSTLPMGRLRALRSRMPLRMRFVWARPRFSLRTLCVSRT